MASGPKGAHLHDAVGRGITSTETGPKRAADVHIAGADVALGGGTQYTEGDNFAGSVTGTAMIGRDAGNDLAVVPDLGTSDGTGVEMGMYVRPLQGDYTAHKVSASLELAGAAVTATNRIPTYSDRTAAATLTAVTVSTTAVLLHASTANRRAFVITNNDTGNLFIGPTNSVTSSGANMGIKIVPGGSYSMQGENTYTGDIYGIYSSVAASQNVAVLVHVEAD